MSTFDLARDPIADFPCDCRYARNLKTRLSELNAQLEAREEFKRYVHARLDAAGVPANPEPEQNAKHGCRIEGRLNWLISELSKRGF